MNLASLKLMLKNPWYVLLILVIIYFITRLINLDLIPIFNDESTYIRYGLHQVLEPEFKAYSLLIGKEPLFPQLFGSFGNATGNYLLGARFVSVLSGLITLLGLYFLALKLENKKTAIFIGILYILSPFNLFYDRLALLDSGISAIAVLSLLFTYLILKKPNWWNALFLGLVLGIGLYIKTTAFFYLGLVGLSGLIILITQNKIVKENIIVSVNLFLSIGIAFVFYAPLYFSEFYSIHQELLKQYTYPITSIFSFPVSIWFLNLESSLVWIISFLTIPIFVLGVFGLFKNVKNLKYLFVSLWLFLPFLYEVLYEKLFMGRHVLLLTIPILFFAAWALYFLYKNKKELFYVSVIFIFAFSIFYNFFILFKPYELKNLYISKARNDISSYFSGFASGYGVMESINYLKQESKTKPIIVLTRNDHGNPEDAVVAYLAYDPNINVILINSKDQAIQVYNQVLDNQNIYFVSRGAYYLGLEDNLTDEKRFDKPDSNEFVGVYRVKF